MLSAERAFCAIIIACGLAYAEPTGKWDDVARLMPTSQILVETTGSKPLQGTLESVTDDVVVIKRSEKQEPIARNSIIRLAVRTTSHRLRNSLIGLAVGTAIGIGVAAIDAHTCTGLLCGLGGVTLLPFEMIGGTAVGAAVPTGGWLDVYRTR